MLLNYLVGGGGAYGKYILTPWFGGGGGGELNINAPFGNW